MRAGFIVLALGLLLAACTSRGPANAIFTARPVLCYAPPFSQPSASYSSSALPACGSGHQLTRENLGVSTSTARPTASIGPDPAFTHVPSTPASRDEPTNTVLLPLVFDTAASTTATRCVLGAAELTNADVQHASVDHVVGEWLVDVTLTPTGSRAWDQLARMQFHAYVALVVNGVVISAPLVEPTQATFSSFSGRLQIAGNFTRRSAADLVAEL